MQKTAVPRAIAVAPRPHQSATSANYTETQSAPTPPPCFPAPCGLSATSFNYACTSLPAPPYFSPQVPFPPPAAAAAANAAAVAAVSAAATSVPPPVVPQVLHPGPVARPNPSGRAVATAYMAAGVPSSRSGACATRHMASEQKRRARIKDKYVICRTVMSPVGGHAHLTMLSGELSHLCCGSRPLFSTVFSVLFVASCLWLTQDEVFAYSCSAS